MPAKLATSPNCPWTLNFLCRPGTWASAAKVAVAREKKTVKEVSVPYGSLTGNLSPALGYWARSSEEGTGGRGVRDPVLRLVLGEISIHQEEVRFFLSFMLLSGVGFL